MIPYQLNPMSLVRIKDGSKRMGRHATGHTPVICLRNTRPCKDADFPAMDATRPFSGGKVTSSPIEVCFASEHRRLGLCKSGYRKAVLARTHSGELACSRRGKGGIRPGRLAYVSSQPF